ncbi:MAG: IS1595 family transposase [Candidatus Bipolaricaulis sp.]|nr:IS1595 family transposase [Candidatus Bipolaricaulis sp.]
MDTSEIKSLEQARREFSTRVKCEKHLVAMRWPDGVTCPKCGEKHVYWLKNQRLWECAACKHHFSVTSGTIFHRSKIDLPRWFVAIWLMCHSPKGISAKQIERELGVCYETAWYLAKRIRKAMKHDIFENKLCGIVEADIGVIKTDGGQSTHGGRIAPSTNVLGMVSRDSGALQMQILQTLDTMEIVRVCQKNFGTVRRIYTDAARSFNRMWMLGSSMPVTHARQWTNGEAHTNYVENAWSLLKRGLVGQFHHVSAKLLQSYLDEFSFRYSHRREKGQMMDLVLASC